MLVTLGALALGSVSAYLAWAAAQTGPPVHPAERWLVLANAAAFGSAYVLGAWSAAFILVLVLHHEVQYLYFTYAMARRGGGDGAGGSVESPAPRLVCDVAGGGVGELGRVLAIGGATGSHPSSPPASSATTGSTPASGPRGPVA